MSKRQEIIIFFDILSLFLLGNVFDDKAARILAESVKVVVLN